MREIVPATVAALPWKIVTTLTFLGTFGGLVLFSSAGGNWMPWAFPHLVRFGLLLGLALMIVRRLTLSCLSRLAWPAYIGSVETLVAVKKALDFRLTGLGPGASLGEQLRNRRLKRGLSIQQVSGRTGLARNTIVNLEQGRGSVASLLKLLGILAPQVRRQAQERAYWGEGDKLDRDSRFTPPDFMKGIYAAFGDVDLDPCAHELSPVIAKHRILLSAGGDGLADEWSGAFAFVNPPFSGQLKWLQRAHEQWSKGNVDMVVCLVPVRTDSAWFQDVLRPEADIFFIRGRIRFWDARGKAQATPFSLMLVALGVSSKQRARFAELVPGYWVERAARQVAAAQRG